MRAENFICRVRTLQSITALKFDLLHSVFIDVVRSHLGCIAKCLCQVFVCSQAIEKSHDAAQASTAGNVLESVCT